MSTHSPHHDGIDRVVSGVDTLQQAVRGISIAQFLPAAMLTGAVTAILVGASHLLSDLFDDGAVTEWLLMWGIALVAVWMLAGQVHSASASLLSKNGLIGRWRERLNDEAFYDMALRDHRVAADLRAAQAFAEREQDKA